MSDSLSRFQQNSHTESNSTPTDHFVGPLIKILVVEDDQQTQEIMQLILGRSNYDVTIVSNGNEALQAIKGEKFDLVFMDVCMPVMDGLEATRYIRQLENGKSHVPIIGTTAIFETEHRRCLAAGMDAVVWKPFDIGQIQQAIAVFVNGHKTLSLPGEDVPDSPPAELPVLEKSNAIRRLGGDHDVFQEALDEFVSCLPQKSSELRCNFESHDWHNLSVLAHNLKGLSASLGALQLSRNARELEKQISIGQFENIEQLLQDVDLSIHALTTMVADLLRQS